MKYSLKKALAFVLFLTGITRLVFFWQFRVRKKILVLLYHEIRFPENRFEAAVSPENFEKQIRFIKKRFEIVSVDKMLEIMAGRMTAKKPVAVITFDDGYRDNFTAAYPILKKHLAPAVIFVAVESVGNAKAMWPAVVESLFKRTRQKGVCLDSLPGRRVFEWNDNEEERLKACHEIKSGMKRVPDAERENVFKELREKLIVDGFSGDGSPSEMLSWDEMRALLADPLMEIGSHSMTHRMLARLPREEMTRELRESKERIQAETGRKARYLSYPGNSYDPEVQKSAKEAGYEAAFAVERELNGLDEDFFRLKRVHIEDGPMPVFQAEIAGVMSFFISALSAGDKVSKK